MNCPNCGAALDWRLQATRMRDCESCGTTVVLDGGSLRAAGARGEMFDAPSMFSLGQNVRIDGWDLLPVGHARFSYGPGWWDEYWCGFGDGGFAWVSVDEGDIAIEHEIDTRDLSSFEPGGPPPFPSKGPSLGDVVLHRHERFRAVEAEEAECVAVRGELPEILAVGERHRYVDFLGNEGGVLTAETWYEGPGWRTDWFGGRWLDPWATGKAER